MLSAFLAFLGGSAFRFLIGQLTSFIEKKQEHAQEMERMRLQLEADKAAHDRQKEILQLQAQLNVQQLQVQGDVGAELEAARAFTAAMQTANTPTGIRFVDAWNGVIRPSAATLALVLWYLELLNKGFVLVDWDKNLIASVLGYFFADRHLGKQGK